MSLHVTGVSSILGSINFIVTVVVYCFDGCCYQFLLVVSLLVVSLLLVTTLPVLACAITVLLLDRMFSSSFLDYLSGGDCVVFQHMF